MPNCEEHHDCDLVCPWCGYYCHTYLHEEDWKHVAGYERRYEAMRQAQEASVFDDMPDDVEEYYNERAERMP